MLSLPVGLALMGAVVGKVADWVLQHLDANAADAVSLGAWSFAAVGLVLDALALRLLKRSRALETRDLHDGEVEVIAVATERVLDVGTPWHPALTFDCGDRTLLYLAGAWLYDPAMYVGSSSSKASSAQPGQQSLPLGFPCTRLVIVRAPRSGAVLRVEIAGEPLAPAATVRPPGMRVAMLGWRDSEVLAGTLPHELPSLTRQSM